MTPHTLIIGAGIGGLTTAALLLKAGHQVTVLDAHVYPGGSAGTFYHKGYRFDAGATLAGGFAPGGPHARLAEILDLTWPVEPVDPAWVVHLPNGRSVTQWADPEQWQAERMSAFPGTKTFWRKQEMLADVSWDISTRPFPWPPESPKDLVALTKALRPKTLKATPYLFSSISSLANTNDPMFKTFLDAQLLISAQTTADKAHAFYGSAAFDLPRRGVNHVQGGIGALAQTLVTWIRENGGEVLFRQQVEKIEVKNGKATDVLTQKGLHLTADNIIANLTPWALVKLLGEQTPNRLRKEIKKQPLTWGAFTLYLGLDKTKLPEGISSHHQVIGDHTQSLGEGNSVFISLSERNDNTRGPDGTSTATISTHTAIHPWWDLHQAENKSAYLEKRETYTEKLLNGAEQAIPGLRDAVQLCLPGTPVTFEFYTKRPFGMVGGFPQTSLFKARGPGTGIPNLWLVGDSIFPGQSTAGVTLGGMRVATAVMQSNPKQQSNQTIIKPKSA